MCKFTLLTYTCGHRTLLSSPLHTELCGTAIACGILPGIEPAPATCAPLADDINDPERIGQHVSDTELCPRCEAVASAAALLAPQQQEYSDIDHNTVDALSTRINKLGVLALSASHTFESKRQLQEKVREIPHAWLRETLSVPGFRKFDQLFLAELVDARDWIPLLKGCFDVHGERQAFDGGLKFALDKTKFVQAKVAVFVKILEGMLGEVRGWDVKGLWDLGEELKTLCEKAGQETAEVIARWGVEGATNGTVGLGLRIVEEEAGDELPIEQRLTQFAEAAESSAGSSAGRVEQFFGLPVVDANAADLGEIESLLNEAAACNDELFNEFINTDALPTNPLPAESSQNPLPDLPPIEWDPNTMDMNTMDIPDLDLTNLPAMDFTSTALNFDESVFPNPDIDMDSLFGEDPTIQQYFD